MKTFKRQGLNKKELKELNEPEFRHPQMVLVECIEAGRHWCRGDHNDALGHLRMCVDMLPDKGDEA